MLLSELEQGLSALQTRYDRDTAVAEHLQEQLQGCQARLGELAQSIDTWRLVQALLTQTSEYARTQTVRHIEALVTAALQAVFQREIRFQVLLRTIGGAPAVEWRVVDDLSDGLTVAGEPEEARGGGVVDVCSLALRLAVLELVRPKPGGPILLDEPGKHVAAEHREALGRFLRAYAERAGRQVLLVTHAEELVVDAGAAYRVERRDGVSEVKAL